jgi:glycosyltransferase involved in cell wall biosynthesis
VVDRRLRIAIDGRELLGRPTGVGRYLWHLLDEWARASAIAADLLVVVPSPPPSDLRGTWTDVQWIVEDGGGSGTLWEQTRLSRAAERLRADVLFAPAYTAPLRETRPLVVTIHDLSYFAHPEWFSPREGTRRRWLTRAAAARASAILTVSNFSASEIIRWLRVPAARVHVTYHGAPPAAPAGAHDEPLILYVGSIFERRHIPELFEAFAMVARDHPTARLAIVGEVRGRVQVDPAALAAAHGVAHAFDWHPYVTNDELIQLYRRARAFAFLSDYEGFALTPLEAIAHGVPPVMLDTPVAREVYRDAARFVPLAPAAIATGLADQLVDGPGRRALLAAGRALLSRYSWSATADATYQVIAAAAHRS